MSFKCINTNNHNAIQGNKAGSMSFVVEMNNTCNNNAILRNLHIKCRNVHIKSRINVLYYRDHLPASILWIDNNSII
jgi:hypothetical protein